MPYHPRAMLKQAVFVSCLSLLSLNAIAAIHPKQLQANETMSKLYHSLDQLPKSDMTIRLEAISTYFLGKPYLLGALGEGAQARYDQGPRYRTDAFDCETYVTTVLAIALAKNGESFKHCMSRVRYYEGQIDFLTRNHFTSLDWNSNNQRQGFIKDITQSFKDKNNKSIIKTATALIDKPSWYQHLPSKIVRLNSHDEKEQAKRLAELKKKGSQLPKTTARIPYIPLTVLFDAHGKANQELFAQIPNAAIIEIVRPNWNLRDEIGTNLNVSHLGFAFWKKGILYFRQASSQYGQVVEVPLVDYLRKSLASPTIKGINVQVIVPQQSLSEGCVPKKN